MNPEVWTAVDRYLTASLVPSDPVLDETSKENANAGLPAIDLTPTQAKLLYLLARIQGAKRILEIGTLGGYSTIWLARALPSDGKLVTLEVDPKHAEVASANIHRAGLSSIVDLRIGPAAQSLAHMHAAGGAAFDFIFIDADKPSNPVYLEWALRLSHVGTVIVVDNVVRDGAVIDANSDDPSIRGSRRLIELLGSEPRLEATAIQTVGSKGYDGFTLAVVTRKP